MSRPDPQAKHPDDARSDPIRASFEEAAQTLRAFLDDHGLAYVVAANKIDALGRGEVKRRVESLGRTVGRGAHAVLGVSAERGEGVTDLWNVIRAAAFGPTEKSERRGNDGR